MTTSPPIRVVAVLGAGTMGHGIAQVSAAAGHETRLFDVDPGQLERGLQNVRSNLQKGIDRGKLTPGVLDKTLANLTTKTDIAAATRGADLVVEAVPEKLELKHRVLGEAAAHVGPGAILGTNTSSLSIAAIAKPLPHPERVIGLHFFNPVHIMKLLEVVIADGTSDAVKRAVLEYGHGVGKQCITVTDSPGFATSRLGLVIGLEAIRMVEAGVASAEDIDKAMTLGYGFPMGPLRLTDLVGLDVRLSIAEYLAEHLEVGDHFKPPELLRTMVAQGKLGKKSGEGFYKW